MWHMINSVIKRKSPNALHHSPAQYAQDLIDTWSEQAQARNLPAHIQDALSTHRNVRTLRLMVALLRADEDDDVLITGDELRRALARCKATAPGDDGVTYQVLRLLLKVPRNPLLQLCFCASAGDTYRLPGPPVPLCPSQSLAQISSGPYPSPPASAKC